MYCVAAAVPRTLAAVPRTLAATTHRSSRRPRSRDAVPDDTAGRERKELGVEVVKMQRDLKDEQSASSDAQP